MHSPHDTNDAPFPAHHCMHYLAGVLDIRARPASSSAHPSSNVIIVAVQRSGHQDCCTPVRGWQSTWTSKVLNSYLLGFAGACEVWACEVSHVNSSKSPAASLSVSCSGISLPGQGQQILSCTKLALGCAGNGRQAFFSGSADTEEFLLSHLI